MSNYYSNAMSYKNHAQYLCGFMCGLKIISLANDFGSDVFSGPPQRTSASGSIYTSDYKSAMPSLTSNMTKYKNDDLGFTDSMFASTISNFYGAMLGNQTSLGNDIESVLLDSLWDIYLD